MRQLPFGAAIGDKFWEKIVSEDTSNRFSERGYILSIGYWAGGGRMGLEAPFWHYAWQKGDFASDELVDFEGRIICIIPANQERLRGHLLELNRSWLEAYKI